MKIELPSRAPSYSGYDGWALVERSTEQELVLYVGPNTKPAAASDADAGAAPEIAHYSITASHRLPPIALGSRLWLHDFQSPFDPDALRSASEFWLSDSEHGTKLIGETDTPPPRLDELVTGLLTFVAPFLTCAEQDTSCRSDGHVNHYSLAVRGDIVRVGEGGSDEITLDGSRYLLTLHRAQRRQGVAPLQCQDLVDDQRLWVSAELASVDFSAVEALSGATLPACVRGNAPSRGLNFGIRNGTRDTLEGPVTYRGKQDGAFLFDAVGGSDAFFIDETMLLAEPTVGEQLWVQTRFGLFVLRSSQDGDILLASASGQSGSDDVSVAADWLGVPFGLERDCDYQPAQDTYLETVVWGPEPSVRIHTDTVERVQLNNQPYDVWSYALGDFFLVTVSPAQ